MSGETGKLKQMEVEALATEIETGVQDRNGPPLDSSQTTSRSVSLRRPFFIAYLPIEVVNSSAAPRSAVLSQV
jgi:hypothetical protein